MSKTVFLASGNDTYACRILSTHVHVGGGALEQGVLLSPLATPKPNDVAVSHVGMFRPPKVCLKLQNKNKNKNNAYRFNRASQCECLRPKDNHNILDFPGKCLGPLHTGNHA